VAAQADPRPIVPLHPLHAFLLAAALPLFLGGLLSDMAYSSGYQIQWSNFAQWLIAGAMVFTGFALLWSFIALLRGRSYRGRPLASFLLLLAVFVLGLVNSFVHARDAFGTMPDGLILSWVVTLLALAATWMEFATLRRGEAK
jgi:uncharacterized membrane protein